MKTKILALTALLLCIISCNAQQIQNRPVTEFNRIEISGSVNVFYTTSDSLNVSVKAKENELNKVDTKVVNSTLVISNKGNFKAPVYVYVKNNTLVHVEASGATEFKTTNSLKNDEVSFSASGSADIHATLDSKSIKVSQSGASDVVLNGSTNLLDVTTAGASTFKGYNLLAKDVTVTATGAATAKVYASERIKANATGASDIKIKGDASDVNAESTSAASITRIIGQPMAVADSTKSDTTVFNWKSKKILIIDTRKGTQEETIEINPSFDKDEFKHWVGFAVGVNGYTGAGGNFNIPDKYNYMDLNYGRSFNFQLNVFERQFNIVKNNIKLVTGLGLDFHSYSLANKTTLDPDSSYTFGIIDSTNLFSYQKNKLRSTYIQVPLLLEFNTSNNPEKTFHIAVGVIGQYLIASRTKQVLEQDNTTIKRIRKDGYNMSPFAAKAHVNMGYKGWTIFAEYSLTPLFQSGKGPELYPFTVGLRVIPFA